MRRARPAETRALTRATVPAVMLGGPDLPRTLTAEQSLALADVWSCVRILSDAVSSLPLLVYRRTDGSRERVRDLPAARLLDRPAPTVTTSNLLGQLMIALALRGNAYLGKYRDQAGGISQLALLSPDRVIPRVDHGNVRYRVRDHQGREADHGPDEVLHIRVFSQDGLVGLSPITSCRLALGLGQAITEHASSWFANATRPSGVLALPPGVTESDMDTTQQAITERKAGGPNAGRVMVVRGEATYTPISPVPADLELLAQRRFTTAEVARIFRVPPHLVNAETSSSMTYATTESEALAFVRWTLAPYLTTIEQALSADRDLFPSSDWYAEFVLDGLLRSDADTRSQIYERALRAGWMTVNEIRALENLPALATTVPPVIA